MLTLVHQCVCFEYGIANLCPAERFGWLNSCDKGRTCLSDMLERHMIWRVSSKNMTKYLFRAEKLTSQELEKSWRLFFLSAPIYVSLDKGRGVYFGKTSTWGAVEAGKERLIDHGRSVNSRWFTACKAWRPPLVFLKKATNGCVRIILYLVLRDLYKLVCFNTCFCMYFVTSSLCRIVRFRSKTYIF